MTHPVLGVVVNPVAGMGGRVGLHGTDDAAVLEARRRGAVPTAPARARRALERLAQLVPDLRVVAGGGDLGGDLLADSAWQVETLSGAAGGAGTTRAADTREAVAAMVTAGATLILFVGGDGTARDVAAVSGDVPVLGVPAGVKMHSAVFGTTPEAAAAAAADYLRARPDAPARGTRLAELVDRDASGALRLHGTVAVPVGSGSAGGLQARKGASRTLGEEVRSLAREVADEMRPGRLYLLGPGTTVAEVGAALDLPLTPLGVDAVLDRRLAAADADERGLLDLLAQHPDATLVLGVVGGQGFLLGRGNQQLSPAVLRAVGVTNIEILAAPAKVAALPEPVLHVDLDDPDLADQLVGYRRVRTGRSRSTVLKVVA